MFSLSVALATILCLNIAHISVVNMINPPIKRTVVDYLPVKVNDSFVCGREAMLCLNTWPANNAQCSSIEKTGL